MSEMRTGRCLCGAVRIRVEVAPEMTACHCVQCQRWTGGGPLFSTRAVRLEIEGGEATRSYRASHWGERVVCATCGSTLWWKMQDADQPSFVSTGMLDDQSGLKVTNEIFVDHRPPWLPPFEGAAQFTEAEELAELDAYLAERCEGATSKTATESVTSKPQTEEEIR